MSTPPPHEPRPAAPPLERTIAGPLRLDPAGADRWRVTAPDRRGLLAYLRERRTEGNGPPLAARIAEFSVLDALAIDWNADADASVTLRRRGRSLIVAAAAVALHEPGEGVYAALPLASFDAPARRFWWRIFRIVRWPGGRRLLTFIARRR